MITLVKKNYNKYNNEFESYELTKNGITMCVPLDEENRDYQEIQEWVKIEGNNIIDPGA
tara:strand:+ start:1424 stop:1600 length:177 start_codon:yes stop_codon:yes gene_type:complete